VIALDFDLACTARLKIEDDEAEMRRLEVASGGLLSPATNAQQLPTGNVIGEVTQANFRDQGF